MVHVHNVKQTIDEIMNYYMGIAQNLNSKIDDRLNYDWHAATKVLRLLVLFWENRSRDLDTSVSNFESEETDKLSLEMYERAMTYFKGSKS